MSPEDKEKFDLWYESESKMFKEKGLEYDLQEQMLTYCKQDDKILLEGMFSDFFLTKLSHLSIYLGRVFRCRKIS